MFDRSRKNQKVRVPEYTFSLLPLSLVHFGFCTNLVGFRFPSLNKLVERTARLLAGSRHRYISHTRTIVEKPTTNYSYINTMLYSQLAYHPRLSEIWILQAFNRGTTPATTCHPSKASRSPP